MGEEAEYENLASFDSKLIRLAAVENGQVIGLVGGSIFLGSLVDYPNLTQVPIAKGDGDILEVDRVVQNFNISYCGNDALMRAHDEFYSGIIADGSFLGMLNEMGFNGEAIIAGADEKAQSSSDGFQSPVDRYCTFFAIVTAWSAKRSW